MNKLFLLVLIAIGGCVSVTAQDSCEYSYEGLSRLLKQAQYDDCFSFQNGYAHVMKDGLMGLISIDGRELLPCKYEEIGDYDGDSILVKQNGLYGMIDRHGRELLPCKYNEPLFFDTLGMSTVCVDDKWGCIDRQGNVVIPCVYDLPEYYGDGDTDDDWWSQPFTFIEGLCRVCKDGRYGFIDRRGREVVPLRYEEVFYFKNGLARVKKNGRYGFVDRQGREVVKCKFNWVDDFNDGLAKVTINERYSFINSQGRVVLPLNYRCEWSDSMICMAATPTGFIDGVASVGDLEHGYRLIDTKGRALSATYDRIAHFNLGYALVQKNGRWGAIDKQGREVEPPVNEYYIYSSDLLGLQPVPQNGKTYYVGRDSLRGEADLKGHLLYLQSENAPVFTPDSCGMYMVSQGWKCGVADANKQLVLPCEYDGIEIDDSLIFVKQEDKWAMATLKGEMLTPFKFKTPVYFYGSNVGQSSEYVFGSLTSDVLVNRRGEIVVPAGKYSSICYFGGNKWVACENRHYGIIDDNGEVVVPFIYSSISDYEFPHVVCRDGKYGYMDDDCRCTLDY